MWNSSPFRTQEATSSADVDSASHPSSCHSKPPPEQRHPIEGAKPDSCVSTSEPTSRAQVLEELRARIRELEGSPMKAKMETEEEHYRCCICKVRSPASCSRVDAG